MTKKLICLIPTWNEEWILDFSLKQNSQVFDFIIVLDQMSSDRTLEIAARYKNVVIKQNSNKSFNEAERQVALIEYARKVHPQSILFALDADEILYTKDIKAFRLEVMKLSLGTSLYMPWLDVFPSLRKSLITPSKQFAYVDDGIAHNPLNIHSPRLPSRSEKFNLQNVAVIHLQYVNLNRNRSKHLWYIHYEMINLNNRNRIRLLSKYLHFVFRQKKTSSIVTQFFEEFDADIENLQSANDKIWNTRLKNDFSYKDKIIFDVYDYFVFNKSIGIVSKLYSSLTFIHYHLLIILNHFKKIISGYYFSQRGFW